MTDVADAALGVDPGDDPADSASEPLGARAWSILRSNPLFWVAASIIVLLTVMAIVPGLFTTIDPRDADLSRSREAPSGAAWFGRDLQGYDILSRCVHGARASILVGLITTASTATVGTVMGLLAGYLGGWVDALISRFAEIFFAIPLILGAIVLLQSVDLGDSYTSTILQVVLVLTVLGWPSIFRLMRSTVLQVKPNDYVHAARALGASPLRIIARHILPNAVGPVIVVSTINLGVFIAAEASLSFLGIGLQPPTVSWGVMINAVGTSTMRNSPHILMFPALFLSITVLAFIMLGDAVRDAFDPKSH